MDNALRQVFCAMTPVDYPNKIKPFLQALSFTDTHVLVVDIEIGLNAAIGELLVGLDLANSNYSSKIFVVLTNITSKTDWKLESIKEKLLKIFKTTSIASSLVIELRDNEDYFRLKEAIVNQKKGESIENNEAKDYTKILIDSVFPVKGIGTVVLGLIKNGSIHVGQMVDIVGYVDAPKKIIIRNIQKHDRNFKTAQVGDRVGLALKGTISPEDINRDNMIVSQGKFKAESEIKARVNVNQFFKPKDGLIKPHSETKYHVISDTKTSTYQIISGDELAPGKTGDMVFRFDRPLYHDGTGLKGYIIDLNKFQNKSRIIGNFEQII